LYEKPLPVNVSDDAPEVSHREHFIPCSPLLPGSGVM
jgi:hypothetical protein